MWNSQITRLSYETAGGGVLKKLGVVRTKGIIDEAEVDIMWDHMKVSTPIISVRKLVKDGNDVYINKQDGYIMNLATGKNEGLQLSGRLLSSHEDTLRQAINAST